MYEIDISSIPDIEEVDRTYSVRRWILNEVKVNRAYVCSPTEFIRTIAENSAAGAQIIKDFKLQIPVTINGDEFFYAFNHHVPNTEARDWLVYYYWWQDNKGSLTQSFNALARNGQKCWKLPGITAFKDGWDASHFSIGVNSLFNSFVLEDKGIHDYFSLAIIRDMYFLIEKPAEAHYDEEGRFHCTDGPALRWEDGFETYFLEGMPAPPFPKTGMTYKYISKIINQEVKRAAIRHFGEDRYLVDSGMKEVATDGYGTLYRRKAIGRETEDFAIVKVVNSTPEPDGTYKDYFLRVPPTVSTPQEAVAWTFGVEANAYHPIQET